MSKFKPGDLVETKYGEIRMVNSIGICLIETIGKGAAIWFSQDSLKLHNCKSLESKSESGLKVGDEFLVKMKIMEIDQSSVPFRIGFTCPEKINVTPWVRKAEMDEIIILSDKIIEEIKKSGD